MTSELRIDDVVEILNYEQRSDGMRFGAVHHFEDGTPIVRCQRRDITMFQYAPIKSKELRLIYRPEPKAPVFAAVNKALDESMSRLGLNPYADILVTLQAGRPVNVKITTNHKPAPEHGRDKKFGLPLIGDKRRAKCVCGQTFDGETCSIADAMLEDHIAKNEHQSE